MAEPVQINIGGQPAVSTTMVGPSSSTTTKKKTKDVLEAEQGLLDATQQSNAAAGEQRQMAADFAAREEELRQKEADAAYAQAAEIQDAQEKQRLIEEERAKKREEMMRAEAAQQEIVDKAAAPTGYWQDMSTPRRILAAIALGMGSAVGTSAPMEMFKEYAAEDKAVKMARHKKEADKLIRMGANREAVLGALKEKEAQIEREHATNLKILSKQAEASAKLVPGAGERATQFKVDAAKEYSDRTMKNAQARVDQANTFAPSTTSNTGTTSTTVNDDPNKAASGARPTAEENKASSQGAIIKSALDVLEPNADLIPDVYSEMASNVTQMEGNSEAARSGVIVPGLIAKARKKGWLPSSPMAGLSDKFGPVAEEVAAAGEQANEAVMRHLSGGAITGNLTKGEEARARNAFSHVAGESVDHAKKVNANLRKLANTMEVMGGKASDGLIARAMADIAQGKEPSVLGQSTISQTNQAVQQQQRAAAQPQAKTASPKLTPKDASAIAWALKNKSDPRAREILIENGMAK